MTIRKFYLWTTAILLAVSLIISLVILFFFRFLPPSLPLFYSLPWGDEQLASHLQFLLIPATLILILLLNLTISSHLHSAQLFFKKILTAATLLITLILTITFLKIVIIFV